MTLAHRFRRSSVRGKAWQLGQLPLQWQVFMTWFVHILMDQEDGGGQNRAMLLLSKPTPSGPHPPERPHMSKVIFHSKTSGSQGTPHI